VCCVVQGALDGLTTTRQFLPYIMINNKQTRLHTSFLTASLCLSASQSLLSSSSFCHSVCLVVFHTGKRDTMFIEGQTYLPGHRQEMAIYRLLSLLWKSHKLPLLSSPLSLFSVSSFHSNGILFPSVAGKERDRSSK